MKRVFIFTIASLAIVVRVTAQTTVPATPATRGTDFVNQFSLEETFSKFTPYVKLIGNDITSTNNGYQLNFALIAFKDSNKWVKAADYLAPTNRFLRNTQVSLATVQKKSYNDATLQITFSLLNRRDSAVYVYLNPQSDAEFLALLGRAKIEYEKALNAQHQADAQTKSTNAYLAEMDYLSDSKNKKNDPAFDKIVNSLLQQSTVLKGTTLLEAWQLNQKAYKNFAKQVQRRPLITLYPYVSYDYVYTGFDKLGFGSTLLVSLDKDISHQPWQLDIDGNLYKGRDSLQKQVNTNQSIAALSIGVNHVLIADKNDKSKFEVKFSGTFQNNWEADVKQKTPNADLTLRYNPFKDFWIPVDIQYDSTRKGIFGYVSITSNLFK